MPAADAGAGPAAGPSAGPAADPAARGAGPASQGGGLPAPRRHWAAAAIWLAMAVTVLDTAIANVALPAMARGLAAAPAASLWVVQAYQLAIVASLLTCSALGEAYGYRRVYLAGLALFTAASLACAAAPGLPALVAARAVQGLGAAAIMGVNGALVRFTFPAHRLGWAFGINALVISLSATTAPALAGMVLHVVSWRWLFGANLAVGAAALACGWRALPDARGGLIAPDWPAAGASALAMVALIGGAVQGAGHSQWRLAAAGAVVSALAGGWLARRARGQAAPLVPFDLIAMPELARAYAGSLGNFASQFCVLISLPFALAGAGQRPLVIGAVAACLPLGLAVAAPLAGRLADRALQPERGGLLLAALGLGLMGWVLRAGGAPGLVALCAGLAGLGYGLFQPANNRRMIAAAPPRRSGAAAGMLAVARLAGQSAGALAALVMLRLGAAGGFAFAAAGLALLGQAAAGSTSARR